MRRLSLYSSRLFISLLLMILSLASVFNAAPAAAACSPLSTTYGEVTNTVSVPSDGTYYIWTRILAPSGTRAGVAMQVDSSALCNIPVGDSATSNIVGSGGNWVWVNYQNGSKAAVVSTTLTKGTHTIYLAGEAAGEEVDQVILTGDANCVPNNTLSTVNGVTISGNNCANPPDTTPPVVSISSPATGAKLTSSSTTVSANATDDEAVAKVAFYLDGSTTAACSSVAPSSGTTYSCALTGLAVGAHTLTAKATDTSNNLTSSTPVSFTVADVSPPTVSLTAPAASSSVSGTVAITATAADNVGIKNVEFFNGTTDLGGDTTSPYSISFNTTDVANGSVSLSAKATDTSGNVTTSSPVSLTVNNPTTPPPDTTPPTVTITSPTVGNTVSGSISIDTSPTDNVGVSQVQFFLDGTALGTAVKTPPYTTSLDTTSLTNASHVIKVTATDAAGNVGTSSVTVTVNNHVYFLEDINKSGKVDFTDFSLFHAQYGQSGPNLSADFDHSGKVDFTDFSLFHSKYGQSD